MRRVVIVAFVMLAVLATVVSAAAKIEFVELEDKIDVENKWHYTKLGNKKRTEYSNHKISPKLINFYLRELRVFSYVISRLIFLR